MDAGIRATQTLLNVLFNKIPQLSYVPTEKKTTHSSAAKGEPKSQEARDRTTYLKKFEGPLFIQRPADSFFEESRQLLFKELIEKEASM